MLSPPQSRVMMRKKKHYQKGWEQSRPDATLHFRRRRDGVEVGMTAIEGPLHLTRSADKRFRRAF